MFSDSRITAAALLEWRTRYRILAGLLCAGIGALSLIGWLGGWPWLTSWGPHFVKQKPVTALCLIAIGAALAVRNVRRQCVLAAAVLGIAVFSMLQDIKGVDFGIEGWLMPRGADPGRGATSFRMSPVTAIALASAALAQFLLFDLRPRWIALALVGATGAIAGLALLVYFVSSHGLYSLPPFSSVAPPTAAALLVVFSAFLIRSAPAFNFAQPRSLSRMLMLLGLSIAGPLVMFGLYTGLRFAIVQQDQTRQGLLRESQNLSAAIDQEMIGEIEMLQNLAASPSLHDGNLSEFQRQAETTIVPRYRGDIVLFDLSGEQLVNSRVLDATSLSSAGDPQLIPRVLAGGQSVISDLFPAEGTTSGLLISVAVPVSIEGRIRFVLARRLEPAIIAAIMRTHVKPEQYLSGVSDRNHLIIARSQHQDRFLGQPISTDTRLKTTGRNGLIETVDQGRLSLQAYVISDLTGWRTAVWVPKAMLEAPLFDLWRNILFTSLLALGLVVALGTWLSRTIATSVRGTVAAARALGRGEPVRLRPTSVAEANVLSEALVEAAELRKSAELALEESRRFVQSLIESAPTLLYIYDLVEQRNVYVSPRIETMLGWSGAEVQALGAALKTKLLHPDDLSRIAAHHARLAEHAGPGPLEIEYRTRHKNGSWRWMISRDIIHTRDADGRPVRVLGSAQDITERRRDADELYQTKRRLDLALQASKTGVWDYDVESDAIVWSGDIHGIFGVETFTGSRNAFMEMVHPDDREPVWRGAQIALKTHEPYKAEFRIVRPSGEVRWVSNDGLAIYVDGKPTRLLGTIRDITERKQAERELARHAERQSLLLDVTAALIASKDAEQLGGIVFDKVAPALDADVCLNYRVDPSCHQLRLVFARGIPDQRIEAVSALRLGQVASSFQPIIADAKLIASDPKGALVREMGVTAYACHPLIGSDGRILGTLSLGSTRRRAFAPEEVDFLQTVTNFLAQAWERLQGEQALAESEAHFRATFEQAGVGKIEAEPATGRIVRVNSRICGLLGFTPEELVGRTFGDITHPDDREAGWEGFRALLSGTLAELVREERYLRKDGGFFWATINVTVARDPSGRALTNIATIQDITARKHAEGILAHFAAIVASSSDAIISKTLDGVVVSWNAAAERIFGYTAVEMVGEPITRLVPPERLSEEKHILAQIHAGEVVDHYETERVKKDGERFQASLTISPIRDASGRIVAASTIVRDITERKRAEERLRRSYETYLRLIENAPLGVYLVDTQFRLAQVSAGAQRVFSNVHPLLGRDFAEVLHIIWPEPFASEATARFRHTLATGEPYHSVDTTERRGDTDEVESYDWQIERVTLPDGNFGVVCYFYDMTERKRYEARIEMLMREVNHRSKNMLGLVQAIARQTAASDPKDFVARFSSRIQALAANQDLLVRNEWQGIQIDDLVRAQLAHFADLIGTRIAMEGRSVRLSPAAAQGIGMALHELATNAGKYGALSNETGRVDISWSLAAGQFSISWRERNGPRVNAPRQTGFGSTVLGIMARMSVGGAAELDYAPTGVAWRLECPAENVLGSRGGRFQ